LQLTAWCMSLLQGLSINRRSLGENEAYEIDNSDNENISFEGGKKTLYNEALL